jgi:peptidoglycan hydrolase-like protein with peptidoglycan-binding domain
MPFWNSFWETVENEQNWVEKQIENVLKETNTDLTNLKDIVIEENILKWDADEDKDTYEKTIDKTHIINILKSVENKDKFSGKNGVYGENSAWITFAVQYALNELWFWTELGNIDGYYGGKTRVAV